MRLNIDIPMDTELVEPLQEGCIWRQARGSATVILGAEDVVGSSEKVPSCRALFFFFFFLPYLPYLAFAFDLLAP